MFCIGKGVVGPYVGGKGESEQSEEGREDEQITAYIPERYHLTVSDVCHWIDASFRAVL